LLSSFLVLALELIGQNCQGYYLLQPNKTVVITTLTPKKKEEKARDVYYMNDSSGNLLHKTVVLSWKSWNSKERKNTFTVKCVNGIFMTEITSFIRFEEEPEHKGIFVEYPEGMKIADELGSVEAYIDVKKNVAFSRVFISIKKRKVQAKETISTPAGKWDCFRIDSKIYVAYLIGANYTGHTSKVSEWFAPGFGVVKTESDYGSSEIVSIK
jgi:hypothetical protein